MSGILPKNIGLNKTISTKQNLDPPIVAMGHGKKHPQEESAQEVLGSPSHWGGVERMLLNQIPTGICFLHHFLEHFGLRKAKPFSC